MSGVEMLAVMLGTGSMIFLGWGFLYKEPQYTVFSWIVLTMLISDALVIGGTLINS